MLMLGVMMRTKIRPSAANSSAQKNTTVQVRSSNTSAYLLFLVARSPPPVDPDAVDQRKRRDGHGRQRATAHHLERERQPNHHRSADDGGARRYVQDGSLCSFVVRVIFHRMSSGGRFIRTLPRYARTRRSKRLTQTCAH